MNILPNARATDIVVQELDKELLIYDLKTDKAFTLNETSMIVFQGCHEQTTFAEFKLKYKFTDEIIYLALDELRKNNLLAEESYASPFSGMTRREVIRKVGLASMVALPVISLLVAPPASHAISGCTTGASGRGLNCPCTAITQCQPPSTRCCVSSPPSALNGTCQSSNVAVGDGGVCGNSCTCISNCCASGVCVAFRTLGSASACTTGCQCSSGTCSGGSCT